MWGDTGGIGGGVGDEKGGPIRKTPRHHTRQRFGVASGRYSSAELDSSLLLVSLYPGAVSGIFIVLVVVVLNAVDNRA
jgi:hypothetical protein